MKKFTLLFLSLLFCMTLIGCSERKVSSVTVKPNSFKSSYAVDEQLNLDGAFAIVTYTSGDKENVPVTPFMVSDFDTSTTGKKSFFVTYDKDNVVEVPYVVYNDEYASRPIETTARFTLYAETAGDDFYYTVRFAQGDLSALCAATMTLTSSSDLKIDAALSNLEVSTDVNNLSFDAKLSPGGTSLKIVVFNDHGAPLEIGGVFLRLKVSGGGNRAVSLANITVTDGVRDYYLPKAN